jgi:CRP/FNR family transcriptional regulator, cyclic AMP receptor protein
VTQRRLLTDGLLQALSARGGLRRFPARAVLLSEEDRSDALYLIISGRIKAYGAGGDGREVVYEIQGPGETFGEICLDGGVRSASVMTLEPTTCVVVPGSEVHVLMAIHPEFAEYMLHKLIGMVRDSTQRVKSLALEGVYQRLTRLLTSLAVTESGGRKVVPERLTQSDIAARIGCSREMVSRILAQLDEGGYVAIEKRRIVLHKPLPTSW